MVTHLLLGMLVLVAIIALLIRLLVAKNSTASGVTVRGTFCVKFHRQN